MVRFWPEPALAAAGGCWPEGTADSTRELDAEGLTLGDVGARSGTAAAGASAIGGRKISLTLTAKLGAFVRSAASGR